MQEAGDLEPANVIWQTYIDFWSDIKRPQGYGATCVREIGNARRYPNDELRRYEKAPLSVVTVMTPPLA
jgi:hypothetical protein